MLGRPDSRRRWPGQLAQRAGAWDLPHEVLDAAEIRRRFPTVRPGRGRRSRCTRSAPGSSGRSRPCREHLRRAEAAGADLRFGEPVLDWTATDRGVRVPHVGVGVRRGAAGHRPGAWAPELLADLGLPLTVERQVMYWFAADRADRAVQLGRHPVWIREATPSCRSTASRRSTGRTAA